MSLVLIVTNIEIRKKRWRKTGYLFLPFCIFLTMKWALLSVWDKTGIIDLARTLAVQKYNIMSSGGTGKALAEAGIKFTEVSSYTGFPEMMDGRVKTLHPKVHGGLLGRRQIDDAVMTRYGINRIDLLVVNLYPFENHVSKGHESRRSH